MSGRLNKKKTILLVGQTPPPFHGQSIATKILFDNVWEGLSIARLRMAYSDNEAVVGRFSLVKVCHLAMLIFRTWRLLGARSPCVLYYPPASPNTIPLLRDVVYLLCVRPFASGTVFHFHAKGLPEFVGNLNPLLRFLAMKAYGKASASIEISKSETEGIDSFNAVQKWRVPNGIDVPLRKKCYGRELSDTFRILYVAGLRESKGIIDLVETALRLLEESVDFTIDVAGVWQESETRKRFEDLVDEQGVAERIVLHGRVTGKDKWALFEAADVFFFPTFYEAENFPLVVIEAMGSGVPIISTRWRGIPEIVVEGTGILCSIRSIDEYVDAIVRLSLDGEGLAAMSVNCRARYERCYNEDAFLEGIRNVFEAVTVDVSEFPDE